MTDYYFGVYDDDNDRLDDRDLDLVPAPVNRNGLEVKTMKNQELRNAAKAAGVRLWEIADALNISESTMTRWMRRELTGAQRAQVWNALNIIKTGGAESGAACVDSFRNGGSS